MGHMTVSNCFLQKYLKFNFAFCQQSYLMRGAIKIEKREKQKCPNFNLGILKTEGGSLFLKEMSQFPLFDSIVCNITFIRNV